ncbi:hypothetical protein HanXRQr2_Chr05g0211141 [Helianthus annuus]|uniref:Uncharacterized protein n=1 Tax=Helianthus annuus TaxID=4232 RepID=A0A9K3IZ72_HELAN|nr:hypothetical protein HanXRQr2_Chr05g0211141 [Helianthus annuus]
MMFFFNDLRMNRERGADPDLIHMGFEREREEACLNFEMLDLDLGLFVRFQ